MSIRVIYKYHVPVDGYAQLPKYAEIVDIGEQDGQVYIWASSAWPVSKIDEGDRFSLVGTGQTYDDTLEHHIGTAHVPPFVWHVMMSLE